MWNNDSTRMPAKMHSRYLRSCFLHNEFARGEFEIDGHRLDPGKVDIDTYVLSAVDDHIVPWVSAYKTTQLFNGDRRFVLSTSGHIAGIVNPPRPKSMHWTNDALPADPQEWKDNAVLQPGTWWEDWATWIANRGGPAVAARGRWVTRPTHRLRPRPDATCTIARDPATIERGQPTAGPRSRSADRDPGSRAKESRCC